MKKIGVLTSGGDAPGMNAAIRAVVRCGISSGFEVYGIYRGYEGLLDGEIEKLDRGDVGDILHRGGTILKTARSEEFRTLKGQREAAQRLSALEISSLIVIGGNGTLKGAESLDKLGINVIGIPGTIDNDLGYTERAIGFDTAVNTVLDAISKIRDTSSSHERTTVIEVMGRKSGMIALYAGLTGGAEAVLIPEKEPEISAICRKILQGERRGKAHSIIINAEGSGVESHELVKKIEEGTGRQTRLVILSYLQRGGVPSMADRLLATQCGARAIELIEANSPSKAIGLSGNKITDFDLQEAVNVKGIFDEEMYKLIEEISR